MTLGACFSRCLNTKVYEYAAARPLMERPDIQRCLAACHFDGIAQMSGDTRAKERYIAQARQRRDRALPENVRADLGYA